MLYIKNNKTKKFVKEKLKTLNELEEGEYLFKEIGRASCRERV